MRGASRAERRHTFQAVSVHRPRSSSVLRRSLLTDWVMTDLRRLVLDVLKPHEPPLLEFTEHIATVESMDGIAVSLIELDNEVQNVKITIEGESLDYEAIEEAIDDLGGSVHSIDQVACGEYIVEERRTLQDS